MRRALSLCVFLLLVALPAAAEQTPEELWQSLMEGNRVYVAGTLTYSHLDEERRHSAPHQNPPVTVLSCSDSRVPPELVFNRSLDQLFAVRVAGNVAGPFDIASIEFAIANGYTKHIVVMGHEECGAVKAALSTKDPGSPSLRALVKRIRENLAGRRPPVPEAVEINTRASALYLVRASSIIRDAVSAGKVKIVTAYYSFDGTVRRLD